MPVLVLGAVQLHDVLFETISPLSLLNHELSSSF